MIRGILNIIQKLKSDIIFRNSIIISGFMLFGQLLSIYRERVLASYIGIGAQLDIYNTAFRIPDIIMAILMSLVATSTIIPFMSQEYYSDNNKYNSKFNSSLILFLSLILIIIIITAIFMPFVLNLLVRDNIIGEDFIHLVLLSRLLLLQPLLLGLSILFSSIGQIRDRFVLSSLSPIIYNLGIIFGVIFLFNKYNLIGVIIGVLIGALGHLILQLFHLRHNTINIHLRHLNKGFVLEHLRLAIPRSGSYLLTEAKNTLFNFILLYSGPGALSIYRLVVNITNIAPAIISGGISTSTLPTLTKYYNEKKYKEHNRLFLNSIYKIIFTMSIIAIFIYLYAESIFRIIYGSNISNIAEMIFFLKIIIWQVIIFSITIQFTTYFNSIKSPSTIFKANLIGSVFILIHFYLFTEYNLHSFANLFIMSSLYLLLIQIPFYLLEIKKQRNML